MNVKRYFARTAREAMGLVRAELGADAIVLKNRPVDGGVEILALADEDLSADAPASDRAPQPADARNAGVAMSTVNFENYVRERQQRRFAAETDERDDSTAFVAASGRSVAPAQVRHAETRREPLPVGVRDAIAERVDVQSLMTELREMRGELTDQLESMTWFEGVRRRPGQSRMLRRLLQAGFSPSLSRTLANHLPADFGEEEADRWLREALVRNLRIDSPEHTIFDAGGTYALLGPTGVGKTTTAAKIAAQFALKHGAQSVGLITADVYRIGAQDQLRTFGRLLGVPVHVAHDVSTLADFLQMYMNRKLVLIDTAGVAQRDERVGELLTALSSAQVRKVLVVNAASQAEAIDETIEAYQGRSAAGVVLSKVDEAVRLGGALDCLIRHRLTLQGVANGQRVPEDWHRPEPRMLVDRALAGNALHLSTSFAFEEAELAMLLSAGQRTVAQRAREGQRV